MSRSFSGLEEGTVSFPLSGALNLQMVSLAIATVQGVSNSYWKANSAKTNSQNKLEIKWFYHLNYRLIYAIRDFVCLPNYYTWYMYIIHLCVLGSVLRSASCFYIHCCETYQIWCICETVKCFLFVDFFRQLDARTIPLLYSTLYLDFNILYT